MGYIRLVTVCPTNPSPPLSPSRDVSSCSKTALCLPMQGNTGGEFSADSPADEKHQGSSLGSRECPETDGHQINKRSPMTHVTKENTTSFLGMIEHFNMLFYWLVWLIAVLADTTQQVAKHLWLLIYWFMFLNTNWPPVVVFLNLLCLHMNFHSLFFWLSTIFQLHSLICTDICSQNEYFLQLKGETGSWGDWVVKCSHQRPEFASFMSEVFAFLLEVPKLKYY